MPILAHRIELVPTVQQSNFFAQCAGAARYFWNRSLARWNAEYEAGRKVDSNSLSREITVDRKFDSSLAWSNQIPRAVISNSVGYLRLAFKRFFENLKLGSVTRPKFKSKRRSKPAFNPWNGGRLKIEGRRIWIPNLGWVGLREALRFSGRIISGVVSFRAGKWFVSITVETETPEKVRTGDAKIGLDFGCKDMVVTSKNEVITGPKSLKRLMAKLKRKGKQLSRKVRGSSNRAKAKLALSKLHNRISNIRDAFQHELTTRLVLANSAIAVEDLNVKGMTGMQSLRKSLFDQRLSTLRYMLDYKSKLYGCLLHVVDRFFPSSKTCSSCGNVKDLLSLSERVYDCEACGSSLSRDHNAAINLAKQIPVLDRESTLMKTGR